MIKQDIKFDFDDLLIVPSDSSDIISRKEVNVYNEQNMLPLFTAPMDTVVGLDNIHIFSKNKIYSILPRTIRPTFTIDNVWVSIALNDFENIIALKEYENSSKQYSSDLEGETYFLVDIANGHMKKLHDLVERSRKCYDNSNNKLHLMVGNVANPETYKLLSDAGADYVRVGVGNGGGCLTSQNVGIGYPLASLISECYEISCTLKNPAKIVADGGMKNYSDVIKALALGSDYVMIGSLFNRALESAGETVKANVKHTGVET